MERPDYRRIHELEYELGFREDPPPFQHTDEPGAVIEYRPPPNTRSVDSILKSVYALRAEREAREEQERYDWMVDRGGLRDFMDDIADPTARLNRAVERYNARWSR